MSHHFCDEWQNPDLSGVENFLDAVDLSIARYKPADAVKAADLPSDQDWDNTLSNVEGAEIEELTYRCTEFKECGDGVAEFELKMIYRTTQDPFTHIDGVEERQGFVTFYFGGRLDYCPEPDFS